MSDTKPHITVTRHPVRGYKWNVTLHWGDELEGEWCWLANSVGYESAIDIARRAAARLGLEIRGN